MRTWGPTIFWAIIWWACFAAGTVIYAAHKGDGRMPFNVTAPAMIEYLFWAVALFAMVKFARASMSVPIIKKWLG